MKLILWCCVAVLAVYIVYKATSPDGQPDPDYKPTPAHPIVDAPSGPRTVTRRRSTGGLQAMIAELNRGSRNTAYRVAQGDSGATVFVAFSDQRAMRDAKQLARTAPGTYCQMVWGLFEKCDGGVCADDLLANAGVVLVGIEGAGKTCTF